MPGGSRIHRRIIPARAGFTAVGRLPVRRHGDHPRSRGVYARVPQGPRTCAGSSPLARGLHLSAIHGDAGSPDHPRSRGVYHPWEEPIEHLEGSSPLARGLLAAVGGRRALRGIIPARAGFTESRARREADQEDHPRSRGVYARVPQGPRTCAGSSPLARGLRTAAPPWRRPTRIIPARAGFTRCGWAGCR